VRTFLIGDGIDAVAAHRPFAAAAGGHVVAFVLDTGDAEKW
jgi:hypothetical protein